MVKVTDDLLTLTEAANLIPGRPPDRTTVSRWVNHGIRAARGELVRLDHVRVGGRVLTTKAAVERFLQRLKGADVRT